MMHSASATVLLTLVGVVLGLLWITAARAETEPWPGGDPVELGQSGRRAGLPGDFEPSGAVWHPRLGRLLVPDDEGRLAALDPDGGLTQLWRIGGDLEAVAIADPATPLIYLGIEHPDTVVEFDLGRGAATGRRWDLSSHMQGRKKKCGLEALTIVDGLFYTGHQCQATIHVFALGGDGSVSKIDEIAPEDDAADLAGMHWDPLTETLYTVYDDLNRIVERDREGEKRRAYTLPGADQEGVASIPRCPGGNHQSLRRRRSRARAPLRRGAHRVPVLALHVDRAFDPGGRPDDDGVPGALLPCTRTFQQLVELHRRRFTHDVRRGLHHRREPALHI